MSEVARLREQIRLECEAAKRGLEGYAMVAKHDFIQARYDNLGKYQMELEKHISKDEASKIVLEVYAEVMG